MPRQADPDLEGRILDAAQSLWIRGGSDSLTMRAVAKAAGTTTPTIYQRFRDRRDILRGLLLRIQQDVLEIMKKAASPEELCEVYLQYGLSHPRQYELYFAHQYEIFFEGSQRRASAEPNYPGRELVRKKLASWLGGTPEDHTRLHLALWTVLHGTAMLVISKTVYGAAAEELKQSCFAAVGIILRDASRMRDNKGRR